MIEPRHEPMIPINGRLGIPVGTVVQIFVILIPLIGAWYSVIEGQKLIASRITELQETIDDNKQERVQDVRELRLETSNVNAEVIRLQEQMKSVQDLLASRYKDQSDEPPLRPKSRVP